MPTSSKLLATSNVQCSDYVWQRLYSFRSASRSNTMVFSSTELRNLRALEALTYDEYLKFLARTDEPPRNLLRLVTSDLGEKNVVKDTANESLMILNKTRSRRSIRILFSSV